MGISERKKELRRRRHRREKFRRLRKRWENGGPEERAEIIRKLIALTPGWEDVLRHWGVEEAEWKSLFPQFSSSSN